MEFNFIHEVNLIREVHLIHEVNFKSLIPTFSFYLIIPKGFYLKTQLDQQVNPRTNVNKFTSLPRPQIQIVPLLKQRSQICNFRPALLARPPTKLTELYSRVQCNINGLPGSVLIPRPGKPGSRN